MTVKQIEFEKVKVTIKYKSLPSARDLSPACETFLKRIQKEVKR